MTAEETALDTEIEEIFEHLSLNNKIVFKSQQIDDPELDQNEKIEIAREIFGRNRQTFLQRFGMFFNEQHLNTFDRLVSEATWSQHESGLEIQDMLLGYRQRLQSRKRDVKNRRYAAMQELQKQGEYFSECEMMKRAPELYQELIGQYLSKEEIKQRDSYDVKNTTFSGILMHSLEQQQRDEVMQHTTEMEQEEEKTNKSTKPTNNLNSKEDVEGEEDDEPFQSVTPELVDEFEVPQSCRQQWGNFENEQIACSTSRLSTKPKNTKSTKEEELSTKLISSGERDLLRQEFVDIMHEQFLSGKDPNFDYTLVDDNTQLDDLSQINQDKEDAYFAGSDSDSENIDEKAENQTPIENTKVDSESEDELDVYMRHLSQHHSLIS